MNFDLQPTLQNDDAILIPLQVGDFETLFALASDAAIWAQHPNRDRYKKEVFRTFFEGAIQSRGAFLIVDKHSGKAVGSTRFYDFDGESGSIFIGYTFYARSHWGTGLNASVKRLMLDYAFRSVSKVFFHIGSENTRSQIAISRIGAQKVAEQEVVYFGEPTRLNFVYQIDRRNWPALSIKTKTT
ncbi:GNAT family N-acetyltransferase [Flavobacterium selenitireducens]|uniref:GNAT family N-acetyltransferase n=1 Tax=Flavobacterium selenitireducens TaxID=2722704 RepID=UPI00168BD959|nr:GNAT family N-acetyltransferase [Flavobacterium selenitireducens]MBD3583058.1 GNAT family N-acetyltransferase [Flavobacterium selenitireducens]